MPKSPPQPQDAQPQDGQPDDGCGAVHCITVFVCAWACEKKEPCGLRLSKSKVAAKTKTSHALRKAFGKVMRCMPKSSRPTIRAAIITVSLCLLEVEIVAAPAMLRVRSFLLSHSHSIELGGLLVTS